MQRAALRRMIDQLRAPGGTLLGACQVEGGARPAFRVPAERYRDAAYFERERAALFGGVRAGVWHGPPRAIAASAQLAAGACLPVDLPGVSLIVTRSRDGAVHRLVNPCPPPPTPLAHP